MSTSSGVVPARSPEALGRIIRAARAAEGITQAELASRSLASRQAVVALESGHETRAIEIMFNALAALNLELVVRPRTGSPR